ncbi:hypothetical protein [Acetobacter senegalensis]|uniref:hypothetical protein n=1 Tax=Acetobacter senegalensis TaxID=446692 RepID=UPI00265147EC|nr:hypothetical protein [Acetobacter senegalensis]MDN7353110.1 hypothetical protein [Acetobacter senegalensis]
MASLSFGTFWYGGRLSALEKACAYSLIRQGCELTLYSYCRVDNVPDGVVLADASEIIPEEMTKYFIFKNMPDLGHFSDFFRYSMFRKNKKTWVDLDMLFLSEPYVSPSGDIVVQERQGSVNGAILGLTSPFLVDELIARSKALMGKKLRWGETGPLLLESVLGENNDITKMSSKIYYPIDHLDIYKIFLPEEKEWCMDHTSQSVALHLFNNILNKIGYWKDISPPEGSYLYGILKKIEAIDFFQGIYPDYVMKNIINNYNFRLNGKDLGLKNIIKQVVPSVYRTYRHYRPS